jgi:hypothetical protein
LVEEHLPSALSRRQHKAGSSASHHCIAVETVCASVVKKLPHGLQKSAMSATCRERANVQTSASLDELRMRFRLVPVSQGL